MIKDSILIRDFIIEEVEKEIIGPDPIEGHTQENGEEIINTKPTKRYGAGVLFPQKTTYSELEGSMADESNPADQDEEDLTSKTKEDEDLTIGGDDDNDSNDEILIRHLVFPITWARTPVISDHSVTL